VSLASVIDRAIEAPVFTSFTSIGYEARRRLESWSDLNDYDVTGRVMVITGGTSGLGRAAADQLARNGARLILIGRDLERTAGVCAELVRSTSNPDIEALAADMGDLDQVHKACDEIIARTSRLDVLLHNAGALTDERRTAPSGIEATVASQVVGPHLMTTLLLDRLRGDTPGRVLTMSSGGMYTAGLTVRSLQMDERSYKGAEQYARAKRAQVTLNEMWAERIDPADVVFHALHPGWADTPGVEASLPTFRKVLGPVLRSPAEGADTAVWLAVDDDEPLRTSGDFWLDRRRRSIHKLPTTRRTDTPDRRTELWEWVEEQITST
jgi:dehydrogenase/reductase SDR family member 12